LKQTNKDSSEINKLRRDKQLHQINNWCNKTHILIAQTTEMFLHKIQSSCSIEEFAFEEEIYHCHCYIFNLRHIVKETGRSLKDKFDHQNISQ